MYFIFSKIIPSLKSKHYCLPPTPPLEILISVNRIPWHLFSLHFSNVFVSNSVPLSSPFQYIMVILIHLLFKVNHRKCLAEQKRSNFPHRCFQKNSSDFCRRQKSIFKVKHSFLVPFLLKTTCICDHLWTEMRLWGLPGTIWTGKIQIDADMGKQENMNSTLNEDYLFCQIVLSPVSKDKGNRSS